MRCVPILALLLLAAPLIAQDADSGFSLPVTLSGGALYSERLQLRDGTETPAAPAFRAMFYPTFQLGSHWFGYAAVQVRSTPYFYYDAYDPAKELYAEVLQAFGGYTFRAGGMTVLLKGGKLSSAFGSFPLHYDDAQNPLLDQPLPYIQTLTLRTDQLPCGTADLLRQPYGSISNGCGGPPGRARGLTPVTLYGLPAVEADVSGHHIDARLQITSGPPASPQTVSLVGPYHQWTAGAGYTIRQGFRAGFSVFRGPYLDRTLERFLPAGTTPRDFPATGAGVDVEWARGRWSANLEWQRFHFELPNFEASPRLQIGTVEMKTRLSPRFFVAGRAGWILPGEARDSAGVFTSQFAPAMSSYELGGGWWLNRRQLLKASYEWLNIEHRSGTRFNVAGIQLVTTFHSLSWAFR